MLFNSNEFLFVFLPITLLAFHAMRGLGVKEFAYLTLLVASIFFYAYWSLAYCLLFIVSIVANFIAARAVLRTGSRSLTAAAIVANLLLLGYFKYTNFLIGVIDQATGTDFPRLDIVLPIGISFYTFIQIAFLVDVYAGKVSEPFFVRYGLFVSFFPHMLAGPVVHHSEMMPQFARALPRRRLQRMLAVGTCLLIIGLVKKVLIADRVAQLASPVFARTGTGQVVDFFDAWVGVLAYSFQIYFDFSGYSDMAIGLALMFGIRFPANFNSPYRSRSIIAFWRRWHMTLSRLLRDYVYIPLGGNRKGSARRYLNLFATMLIGGIWHGAGWTFLLWGGLHGLFLAVNHLWNESLGRRLNLGAAAGIITFLLVVLAWVPFRATDLAATLSLYGSLFGANGLSAPLEIGRLAQNIGIDLQAWGIRLVSDNQRAEFYINLLVLALAAGLAWFAPNSMRLLRRYDPVLNSRAVLRDGPSGSRILWRPGIWSGLAAGAALFLVVRALNSAAPSEFLYFQF